MRLILFTTFVLYNALASDDCFFKNPTCAGSTPSTVTSIVAGSVIQKVQPLVTGLVIDDYESLNTGVSFISANMKVSNFSWCTERPSNKGRLVMIQASVQEDSSISTSSVRKLSQIGGKSAYCYTMNLNQS